MKIQIRATIFFICLLGAVLQACKSTKTVPDQQTTKEMLREKPGDSVTAKVSEGQTKEMPMASSKGYTETVPATEVSFDMVALPGGSFVMGSPESEANRKSDEGPQKEIELDPFYMGK